MRKSIHTLLLPLLLAALAVAFGYRSYGNAAQRIADDLSQAVQRTVLAERTLALHPDTLRAYARLSRSMGAPVTISSHNPAFAEALAMPALRRHAVLTVCVPAGEGQPSSTNALPSGCLASDTVLWMAPEAGGAVLSFRAYARCTPWFILSQSDLRTAGALLLAALLCGGYACLGRRRRASRSPEARTDDDSFITLGNLSLSVRDDCFYDHRHQRLHLTPMQYALMQMFYQNDAHRLTKQHICRSLWPGKDNADETLYTLIRRLKPIVEAHSNLHISSDRGRAYVLEINE